MKTRGTSSRRRGHPGRSQRFLEVPEGLEDADLSRGEEGDSALGEPIGNGDSARLQEGLDPPTATVIREASAAR